MRENLFWSLTMEEAFVYFEDVKDMGTGAIRNLQTTKKKFRDATGRLCVLGMCVDVTTTTKVKVEEAETQTRKQEEKKQQALEKHYQKDMERLSYIANHDELTGVYNRAGYDELLTEIDLSTTYMLLVDIDNFKSVNDTFGHEIGDRVLVKVANTLNNYFRSLDSICRIGGDEFVILMGQVKNVHHDLIVLKMEKINQALKKTEDGLPAVSVSVGIAHGGEAKNSSELFELADRAMYEAKRNGKQGYQFFADLR